MSASSYSTIVVTPVFEDREAVNRLFEELAKSMEEGFYVVAIDDGSVEQPLSLDSLRQQGVAGTILTLRRNVGHQRAIAIGLSYVQDKLPDFERVIVMDSDGEDVPGSIADLVKPLQLEDVDIVVAERKSRVETPKFRLFYLVYKWLFRLLSGHSISFGNFMAMKPAALSRLVSMQELWIHVAGCVLASKLRVIRHALDRGPRYAGKSKMNFVGLALHGFRGLMIFAEDVLLRVGLACALIALFSIVGGAAAIVLKVLSFATPWWFSVALGILLLVFLQTGTLTLMTLMLTGVVKGNTVTAVDYLGFVAAIKSTDDGTHV